MTREHTVRLHLRLIISSRSPHLLCVFSWFPYTFSLALVYIHAASILTVLKSTRFSPSAAAAAADARVCKITASRVTLTPRVPNPSPFSLLSLSLFLKGKPWGRMMVYLSRGFIFFLCMNAHFFIRKGGEEYRYVYGFLMDDGFFGHQGRVCYYRALFWGYFWWGCEYYVYLLAFYCQGLLGDSEENFTVNLENI